MIVRQRVPTPQVITKTTILGNVNVIEAPGPRNCCLGTWKGYLGIGHRAALSFVNSPWFRQLLVAAVPYLLLVGRVEEINVNGELPAQIVHQCPCNCGPSCGACRRQRRVTILPFLLIATDIIQIFVVNLQQTRLLQVGCSEPPSPA